MALPAGLALNDGLAVAGSGGGGGGDANNILGGAANEILYQVATDTTGFIPAPSIANTFLEWDGAAFTWSGASGGLTVGATGIASGTDTRVLFDNAGVLGEYAISGTGSVAMTNSPTLVTPALGTPSAINLANATNLPMAAIAGLDANVAVWLATPTSANLAAAVTNETGSGALVFATSPTLVTPNLGVPSAINLANATNLPISAIASLGANVGTWLATPSSANLAAAVTDETGSGSLVFATSPTLVTPALGTPSAVNLANATNLPVGSIAGLGTGVATFLATPSSANLAAAVTDETGSGALVFATSPTLVTPALGTPSAVNLANATNLPVGSIAGLGTGVATWLATPSSANLAAAVTDETGSGALVFATSPVLVTPNLGTPSAVNLANATNLPVGSIAGLGTGVATWLATPLSANLAAAVTDETGSGALVFANTPTLVTPVLGAATGTSVVLTGGATILSGTGITAGGSTTGFELTSTANFGLFVGSGAPTISTAQGSLYLRSDGVPYYNTNGTTGWNALVPAGAVTSSGLTMATSRLLGRTTASTGAIEEITADSNALTFSSTTLSVKAGNWVLIASATASSSSTIDFTGFNPSLYDVYKVEFWDVRPDADNFLRMRTSTDGGSSYDSGASDYIQNIGNVDGSGYILEQVQAADSSLYLNYASTMPASTDYPAFGTIEFYSPQSAQYSQINWDITFYFISRTRQIRLLNNGWRTANADVNAIRFFSGGTILTGEFRFYGRRK